MLKNNFLLGFVTAVSLGFGFAVTSINASADTVTSSGVEHTVVQGDTLWGLSQKYGVSINTLFSANNKSESNTLLQIGDTLIIPGSGSATSNTTTVATSTTASTSSSTASATTSNTTPATTSSVATASSTTATSSTGSVYDQFIAAGGTSSLWTSIVLPESGGNPTASNGQYHGLGQTAESWGYGSVATQTKGLVNYAVSRYGSVSNAISFRAQHGWW